MKVGSKFIVRLGLCLLMGNMALQTHAQEDRKHMAGDSVRTVIGTQKESVGHPLSNRVTNLPDTDPVDTLLPRMEQTDSLLRFSIEKPLVIPYYTNPSPMLRGDYATGGLLGTGGRGVFYGSGEQTTLPGIGRMNEASLGYAYQFNSRWSMQAGINALKMNIPFAIGQSFGVSGAMMYQASDRMAFKVFGSYYRGQTYGMESHSYGASMIMRMSNRFNVEAGVQRRYNPMRGGWETVPILVPTYRFNKVDLGIDVGGLLYEILHNAAIHKNGMMMGNPTIGPPSHPSVR